MDVVAIFTIQKRDDGRKRTNIKLIGRQHGTKIGIKLKAKQNQKCINKIERQQHNDERLNMLDHYIN